MPTHARATHARTKKRSVPTIIGDCILQVLAVGGVICIALVICAFVFDITLIMFKTGSMSPTIPTGSLAVVREVPADSVEVGDVVTVERPGRLPITHRVTAVAPVPGGAPDARRITMRGDANAVEDPFPYDVDRVRVVVFSVPGIAPVLSAAGTPPVLAAVTVAATALVVGMFWPRRRRDAPRPEASDPAGRAADEGAP